MLGEIAKVYITQDERVRDAMYAMCKEKLLNMV